VAASERVRQLLRAAQSNDLTLERMQQWGRMLGAALDSHSVVTLDGDLGAGKTTLARAICEGAGVLDVSAVTSPTFAIMQEYASARGVVVHADLYRLTTDADLDQLGWDEVVDASDVLIVEWPDRVTRGWPMRAIALTLSYATTSTRRVRGGLRE
jgi:tRNA threonylcarbamoyladenosine biosynthesis protein TsaE